MEDEPTGGCEGFDLQAGVHGQLRALDDEGLKAFALGRTADAGDQAVIPLIDLSRRLDEVADALADTLEHVGFFIVVNHGVPQELIRRVFAEAERFHAQPRAAKHAVLMNEHNNGYMAMARYNVRTSRVSEAALPDMNEAFFVKRERGPDDPLAGQRFAGPNRWPADLPGFRETVLEYCETVDRLAVRVLPALSLSLGLPQDWFAPHFRRSQFTLRLSHYPPAAHEPGRYGIAPHTDANFLTFLAQSGVPGLQIRRDGDRWEDVPFVADSFVVNTGDMLHRWTNGRYQSTPHRALPPVERHRYAIPYFFGPDLDAEIRCAPTCTGPDNPPRWPPIVYEDHLAWWYDANYNAAEQQDLVTGR